MRHWDLHASKLTLTIGFGPSLFDANGKDRFGIADRKPRRSPTCPSSPETRSIRPAPAATSRSRPAPTTRRWRCTRCATWPASASVWWRCVVAARIRAHVLDVDDPATPRNLFGFKDGTRNIKAEDPAALSEFVWVDPQDDQAWMAGGSYLVARRIRMLIEPWDRTTLHEQERVFGRTKGNRRTAVPQGRVRRSAAGRQGRRGKLVIDKDAHVRLASAEELNGIQILRRGYNFTDGTDGFGHLDAGLFFIAYCRDPQKQFVPMQQNLARNDALNEYIKHVGSAVFAVPPGVGDGDYWGSTLFEA